MHFNLFHYSLLLFILKSYICLIFVLNLWVIKVAYLIFWLDLKVDLSPRVFFFPIS